MVQHFIESKRMANIRYPRMPESWMLIDFSFVHIEWRIVSLVFFHHRLFLFDCHWWGAKAFGFEKKKGSKIKTKLLTLYNLKLDGLRQYFLFQVNTLTAAAIMKTTNFAIVSSSIINHRHERATKRDFDMQLLSLPLNCLENI